MVGDVFIVTVIVVGNGIGDPSSNPTEAVCISLHDNTLEKGMDPSLFLLWVNSKINWFFIFGEATSLEEKLRAGIRGWVNI